MRELKRLLLAALVLTFVGGIGLGAWIGTLAAAPAGHRPRTIERRVRDWQRYFDLSPTQQRQLRMILSSYDQEVRRTRQEISAEQLRRLYRAQEKSREQVRERVLSAEQRREYDKLRKRD